MRKIALTMAALILLGASAFTPATAQELPASVPESPTTAQPASEIVRDSAAPKDSPEAGQDAAQVVQDPAAAAELKPVLTISVSNLDSLRKDLEVVVQESGDPFLWMLLLMSGQRTTGVDSTKPWGAVIQTDGENLFQFAFLPVPNLEQMLSQMVLPGEEGPQISQPDENGVLDAEMQGTQFVIAQKGDWAFIADNRQTLDRVPDDPVTALAGLDQSHALAARLNIGNVPQLLRQMPLDMIQLGASKVMQRKTDETAEEHAARQEHFQRLLRPYEQLLNETDSLQLGLSVDGEARTVILDMERRAVAGTATDAEYTLAGESKSNLAGFFFSDASASALVTGAVSEHYAARAEDYIKSLASRAVKSVDGQELAEAEKQQAKQLLEDFADVALATVKTRHFDVGGAVFADVDALTVVAAGHVANAAKLEKLVKQFAQLGSGEDPAVEKAIALDAEQYKGIRFHTLSVPADELMDGLVPEMIVGSRNQCRTSVEKNMKIRAEAVQMIAAKPYEDPSIAAGMRRELGCPYSSISSGVRATS